MAVGSRRSRLISGSICAGGVRKRSHSVEWMGNGREAQTQQGEQLHEWELRRASKLEESSEHHGWTHLEQVQHCTDLPLQATFPAHNEQGEVGPGLG